MVSTSTNVLSYQFCRILCR